MNSEKVEQIVQEVINNWDPLELLQDIPEGEYSEEIKDLASKLTTDITPQKCTDLIITVFSSYQYFLTFNSDYDTVKKIGQKISERLSAVEGE